MTVSPPVNQTGKPRSNRGHRTHYGNRFLQGDRQKVIDQGTVYDKELGKEYHEVWMSNKAKTQAQQTLFITTESNERTITFDIVDSKDERAKQWTSLCHQFHYVPHSSSSIKGYGRFLRYFIKLNGIPIGLIAIAGSFLSLDERDKYIGWNKEQRMKNNRKICQNLIYCIFPSIKIPNLSSQILSQFVKVARRDWKKRYGDNLVLIDTLVDPKSYKGTSYIASGWINVGMTKGFGGKGVRKITKGGGPELMGRVLFKHDIPKMIFIKPLHRYWRRELLTLENTGLGPSGKDPIDTGTTQVQAH